MVVVGSRRPAWAGTGLPLGAEAFAVLGRIGVGKALAVGVAARAAGWNGCASGDRFDCLRVVGVVAVLPIVSDSLSGPVAVVEAGREKKCLISVC